MRHLRNSSNYLTSDGWLEKMRIPMLLLWGILTNWSQRHRYALLLSAVLIACGLVGSMAIVFPIVQYAVIALFLIVGKASERATKWSGKLLLRGNAVDAAANDAMRFHGLTQLIRFARIDMGVQIDIDLRDLSKDAPGFSRKSRALGYHMINRLMREEPEIVTSLWPDLQSAAQSEAEATDALQAAVAGNGLSNN